MNKSEGWTAISPYAIKKICGEMDFSYKSAVKHRLMYLCQRLWYWGRWFEYDKAWEKLDMPYSTVPDIIVEMRRLIASLERKEKKGDITEDQVEYARNYPIDKLLEFKHGKTICPFHEDTKPSMFHATRTNHANCPVCNKSWDAIEILIQRDNLNFIKAVETLCQQ
jgi:hypothetical protein